ncbi:MAG: PEP-CTERM sorting domain-containing protein [Gammaproteobacteria bacterium]|nr:PEP-CTERM sorting domain-containing protein [Gammaproteobacteria bacterium]
MSSLNLLSATWHRRAIFLALMLAVLAPRLANANPINAVNQLDVEYTGGSITSGPLSFGLGALPNSVSATFLLGAGTTGLNSVSYSKSDVVSANVAFGDATWNLSLLDTFPMTSILGSGVISLDYRFLATTSPTTTGSIIMNFPLRIIGTDITSGKEFEYGYTTSTQTVSAAPVPGPSVLALLGLGLLGLGFSRRRQLKALTL